MGRAFGPSKLLTSREICDAHGGDESGADAVAPDMVVLAESADDVARALAVAAEAEIPITPRGAGTGKSGGCIPAVGGIVLSTVGMRSIVEIDREELVAVVEPGVVLADLHAAVEAEGLFYPPDPNSLALCALGGNIAENAGGPRAFKYGVTREYVCGLDVALVGGTRLVIGHRTKKGVTGYDVTSLLVGSEGTLAVTTRATLRLVPKPAAVATLLALFADVAASGRAVTSILAAGLVPRCLELFDASTLEVLRGRGLPLDPHAGAMLLIEVDGDPVGCESSMERIGAVCNHAGALEVLCAQDAAQRARLWDARRELSHATRAMARYKLSEDVVVPRTHLSDLIQEVVAIGEATAVRVLTYGHAGDGNLHVNFLWDDPADAHRVEDGLGSLFRAVVAMRGTLTGEHGVGLSKADYLHLEQSPALIELQRGLKAVFDPKSLLNPHKIFPRRAHGAC